MKNATIILIFQEEYLLRKCHVNIVMLVPTSNIQVGDFLIVYQDKWQPSFIACLFYRLCVNYTKLHK